MDKGAVTYYEGLHGVFGLRNGIELWLRGKIRRYLYGDTPRENSFHLQDTKSPKLLYWRKILQRYLKVYKIEKIMFRSIFTVSMVE